MEVITKWLKSLWWFMILFIPLIFVIIIPMFIAYDYINPWEDEVEDLKSLKPNNVRLLVGFTGYSGQSYRNGDFKLYKSHERREWIVFPSVFTEPHTYEYYKYKTEKPSYKVEVSKSKQVNENRALEYLFLYIAAYLFCWFVSKPKISKWYRNRAA